MQHWMHVVQTFRKVLLRLHFCLGKPKCISNRVDYIFNYSKSYCIIYFYIKTIIIQLKLFWNENILCRKKNWNLFFKNTNLRRTKVVFNIKYWLIFGPFAIMECDDSKWKTVIQSMEDFCKVILTANWEIIACHIAQNLPNLIWLCESASFLAEIPSLIQRTQSQMLQNRVRPTHSGGNG